LKSHSSGQFSLASPGCEYGIKKRKAKTA